MADVTQTAADIAAQATTSIDSGEAGAALSAGDWVKRDSNDQFVKAISSATFSDGDVVGICLNDTAAAGQPMDIATAGKLTCSTAASTAGTAYFLSAATSGKAADAAAGSGDHQVFLALGLGNDEILINITKNSAALVP